MSGLLRIYCDSLTSRELICGSVVPQACESRWRMGSAAYAPAPFFLSVQCFVVASNRWILPAVSWGRAPKCCLLGHVFSKEHHRWTAMMIAAPMLDVTFHDTCYRAVAQCLVPAVRRRTTLVSIVGFCLHAAGAAQTHRHWRAHPT